ncbi:twin-arginine translocase subunit TatC [Arthrobacter sp. 35W]|uniref:twin-arginine translocase subunit TatC n=1 Tax=Arthrobacter sp. 35W TaxID=1132441 RepID=UPI0004258B52|nr:twin-arginine translocase subunit TatC [Arthrobacter sp. 35W]
MALKDHLIELRNRLFKCAIALVLGAVAGWIMYDRLFTDVAEPIMAISRDRGVVASLNFDGVSTSFDLKIQASIFLGAIFSSPVWIYQLWAFITPGLTKKERGYTLAYMFAAIPLFAAGIWTGWLIMPNIVHALTSFTPTGGSNIIHATDYMQFVMQLMLFMGISFLVPVVLVGVNAMGLVRGRTMLKAWRITILAVTLVSAMAAPGADAFSMFFLAAPLLALYFGAIGLCMLNDKRRDRKIAKTAEETGATADHATPLTELGQL